MSFFVWVLTFWTCKMMFQIVDTVVYLPHLPAEMWHLFFHIADNWQKRRKNRLLLEKVDLVLDPMLNPSLKLYLLITIFLLIDPVLILLKPGNKNNVLNKFNILTLFIWSPLTKNFGMYLRFVTDFCNARANFRLYTSIKFTYFIYFFKIILIFQIMFLLNLRELVLWFL